MCQMGNKIRGWLARGDRGERARAICERAGRSEHNTLRCWLVGSGFRVLEVLTVVDDAMVVTKFTGKQN
jgi:hypothetical protein